MTDRESLQQLLKAHHPCIHIVTQEEDYALRLLTEIAVENQLDLWTWSITRGVRDGLVMDSVSVADTEHPAAALYSFCQSPHRRAVRVMLDLSGHLKDERTLRLLREA